MEQKLRAYIKEAMLEKNKNKQIAYKGILENAQKIAKKTNEAVTDEMILTAAKNEIKQLEDLKQYCKEGTEKYQEVMEKIEYCKTMLPAMATEEDVKNFLVTNGVEKNIGVCMKTLKQNFGAKLDGRMAQGIVKEYINS